jgi:hypothetical protein
MARERFDPSTHFQAVLPQLKDLTLPPKDTRREFQFWLNSQAASLGLEEGRFTLKAYQENPFFNRLRQAAPKASKGSIPFLLTIPNPGYALAICQDRTPDRLDPQPGLTLFLATYQPQLEKVEIKEAVILDLCRGGSVGKTLLVFKPTCELLIPPITAYQEPTVVPLPIDLQTLRRKPNQLNASLITDQAAVNRALNLFP